jgi:metallophosphoesterase (TIGR00282 family)
VRIFFIGDIFGKPGRRILKLHLEWLLEELRVDVCVANVENAAAGKGINKKIAEELFLAGIDLMTLGNHAYDNKEVFEIFDAGEERIVRPLNYPEDSPGPTITSHKTEQGETLTVVQLMGRVHLPPCESPFDSIDAFLEHRSPGALLVDVHAEATSEKQALGWHLDGRVSAVVGTHTHVQTADAKVLPRGTAFITDVGMTGPHDGIIGGEKNAMMRRFLTRLPTGLEVAKGDPMIHAVLIETERGGSRATSIARYCLAEQDLNKGILE